MESVPILPAATVLFFIMLAKLGVETVVAVIGAWKQAGEPTDEKIRVLLIKDKPEDLLKT